jgi:hypothetical protein
MATAARIAWLEAKLVSEFIAAGGIYGYLSEQQRSWARAEFPGDWASYFMPAWRTGRRQAWRRIKRMASELQVATGDGDDEWELRIARLQVLAGISFDLFPQSTLAAPLVHVRD